MFYIVIAILLWSSLGVIIRLTGLPVLSLIFFPCAVSLLPLGMLLLYRRSQWKTPDRNDLGLLVLLSVTALINTGTFFFAYQYTSIANAVLTHYTAPVIVAFLAPIILKERFTFSLLGAVALAAAGLWIMLGASPAEFVSALVSGDRSSIGILSGLVSGIAYAFVIILIRTGAQRIDPVVMTFGQNLLLVVMLMPFIQPPAPFFPTAWIFLVIGLLLSTVAPVLYFRGMRDVTANKAAILGYLEPVAAILLGFIVLSEPVGFNTVVGGCMILLSGYLTRRI
ncbi:MAG: Permease drug/metabolite transporter (DMT) superfamily [Nitrospirae bacterium]|nr:MAG: Permease drug/metabolite transporter (DMT) superfamily [Nitrospirota bacterium]